MVILVEKSGETKGANIIGTLQGNPLKGFFLIDRLNSLHSLPFINW
jgi:hypothetical protein